MGPDVFRMRILVILKMAVRAVEEAILCELRFVGEHNHATKMWIVYEAIKVPLTEIHTKREVSWPIACTFCRW